MSPEQILAIEALVFVAVVMMLAGILIARRNRKLAEPTAPMSGPTVSQDIVGTLGRTLTRENITTSPQSDAIIVLRDPASGEWQVEVNGNRYNNLKDIHDDQSARKVLDAIGGLQRFAGSISITMALGSIAAPSRSAQSGQPAPGPASNVIGNPKFPAPKDSILAQIENVLQRKLLKNPDLVERHIHIGAEPDGSLLIEVDKAVYKSPDDVPDEAVRAVIKASIQDWERA